MKDSSLLVFAIIVGFVGLLLIQIISFYSELPISSFSEAKEENDYSEVRLTGRVVNVRETGEFVVVKIVKEEEMDVYVPVGSVISEGELLDVVGEIKSFKRGKVVFASRVLKG